MKRKAPTTEEIDKALNAAGAGKGRQLALLIKSFSIEDLAAAFGAVGQYDLSFFVLGRALNFAAGRKSYRECRTADLRVWRKQRAGDEE